MSESLPIEKIVSGGQTGADRAALDFALAYGIPHGGWCPKGRCAEDGPIDRRYCLKETPCKDYAQRTEWNVRDSDATVIFSTRPELSGGSLFTKEVAERLKKPFLWIAQDGTGDPPGTLRSFLETHRVRVLNVAGPRRSQEPEVGEFVWETLRKGLCLTDQERTFS